MNPSHPSDTARLRGVTFALLAAFGFSMKAIFIKLAYAYDVGALPLLTLRMAFSLPAFAWVGLRQSRGAEPLTRPQWGTLVLLGLLGYYASSLLDFMGLQWISAGLERLILFTYPALTVLFTALVRRQPVTRRELGALLLCYLGIALAFAHDLRVTQERHVWLGAGLVFAASVCFAIYLTGSGKLIERLGAARFTALAMMVSTAACLLHFAVTQPISALFGLPWQVYGLVLAMAVFSTVLPAFFQSSAIRALGAGRSAQIGTIGPVLTLLFGWWWLNEAISVPQLMGMALVIAGVVLASKK